MEETWGCKMNMSLLSELAATGGGYYYLKQLAVILVILVIGLLLLEWVRRKRK